MGVERKAKRAEGKASAQRLKHGITLMPTDDRFRAILATMRGIETEIARVAATVPSEPRLRVLMATVYAEECPQLEQLRGDVVRLLTLCVKKGMLDQEELNRAIAGDDS